MTPWHSSKCRSNPVYNSGGYWTQQQRLFTARCIPACMGRFGILDNKLCFTVQNNLSAGMIVAGYDARDGGSVYALPLGGTLVKVPFSIGARSGPYVASTSKSLFLRWY